MLARRYLVRGVVQGVGFRFFTARAARAADLRGYVRNLPDGRVEVAAEGDGAALEQLDEALRHGPPLARVDEVEVEIRDPAGGFSRFEIRE